MKNILLLSILIVTVACNNDKNKKASDETTSEENKLSFNHIVPDPEEQDGIMLLGMANKKGLNNEPFKIWFDEGYNDYEVSEEIVEKITPFLKSISIKVFMGTWCEDSQREIPHLYKILDAANFNYDNFSLVTVSREKDTPQGYEKDYKIEYVPTIILFQGDKELGRFVEYARESLEADLLAILSGAEYKHAYQE